MGHDALAPLDEEPLSVGDEDVVRGAREVDLPLPGQLDLREQGSGSTEDRVDLDSCLTLEASRDPFQGGLARRSAEDGQGGGLDL